MIYQLIFSTKNREKSIVQEHAHILHKYIAGVFRKKECVVYTVGGYKDHVHIVFSLHPKISLSDLVKDVKVASSIMMKEHVAFPDFTGWQNGYGAFTYSNDAKESPINYVDNQEEHHRNKSFKEELIEFLHEHGVEYDEKYL